MRISIFIFIPFFVVNLFASVTLLSGDGRVDNRLRVMMVGDGYTSSQEADFVNDAKSVLATMKKETFYSQFDGAINFYAAFKASAESGADHPLQGTYVNTAFDGTFGSTSSLERLVTANSTKVKDFLATEFDNYDANYDITLVVINDTQYGGSGGQIATTTTNSSGPMVAIHEIGHSFGKLTDEYDYQQEYQPGEHPNSTAETVKNNVKWAVWFDDSTPVPTPENSTYNGVVGLFEGACYRPTGWYRPVNNCAMKALGNPLCPVCTEQMVTNSYKLISPIDTVIPSVSKTLNTKTTDQLVIVTVPLKDPPKVSWFVNGKKITAGGDSLILTDQALVVGSNEIKAIVTDNSGLVRISQNLAYASDTVSWSVDNSNVGIKDESAYFKYQLSITSSKSGFINFTVPVSGNYQLKMFDLSGRMIVSQKIVAKSGANIKEIAPSQLARGVVFVNISGNGMKSKTVKLVY